MSVTDLDFDDWSSHRTTLSQHSMITWSIVPLQSWCPLLYVKTPAFTPPWCNWHHLYAWDSVEVLKHYIRWRKVVNIIYPLEYKCLNTLLYITICFSYRLVYAILLLKNFLTEFGPQINVMYDVACVMEKHLLVCVLFIYLYTMQQESFFLYYHSVLCWVSHWY